MMNDFWMAMRILSLSKRLKRLILILRLGDELTYELPLDNLGQYCSGYLTKELEYHIQRLLETNIFDKYQKLVGKTVFGSVVRIDNDENTYIEIDEIRAVLPRKNRIKGEKI